MFKFIALATVLLLGGGLYLKSANPEAWTQLSMMWKVTGGGCAPSVVRDPVFMPRGEDCKPLAEMRKAPNVTTDGDRPDSRNIALMIANPLAFGDARLVLVEYVVSPTDLLEVGETLPEAADARSKLVQERIAKQGDTACDLLPDSFAQRCMTTFTGLDLAAISAGTPILVTHRLTYSPSVPIGDLPQDNGALRLGLEQIVLPEGPATDPAGRVGAAAAAAEAACSQKRAQYGNCMISSLMVRERKAQAELAWITP